MKKVGEGNILIGTISVYLVDEFPIGTTVWDAPLVNQKVLIQIKILNIWTLNFGIA